MLLGQWRVFPEASLLDTGTEAAVVPSQSGFHISGPFVPFTGVSPACSACRHAFRSGVFSECGFTCYLPQQGPRQRATATLPPALRLREVEPGREQSGGWMSGRMFPPLATTDPRGDGIMQTATAPGASSRTFLIHMFMRGLDDNRYVVERASCEIMLHQVLSAARIQVAWWAPLFYLVRIGKPDHFSFDKLLSPILYLYFV